MIDPADENEKKLSLINRLITSRGSITKQRLWTTEDVHAFTKIPISTIKHYIKTESIPSVKVGRARRFVPVEIKRWVRSRDSERPETCIIGREE